MSTRRYSVWPHAQHSLRVGFTISSGSRTLGPGPSVSGQAGQDLLELLEQVRDRPDKICLKCAGRRAGRPDDSAGSARTASRATSGTASRASSGTAPQATRGHSTSTPRTTSGTPRTRETTSGARSRTPSRTPSRALGDGSEGTSASSSNRTTSSEACGSTTPGTPLGPRLDLLRLHGRPPPGGRCSHARS